MASCDPLAEFQWSARAPLINTSPHVLQILLCHLQFPNCPRHTQLGHCSDCSATDAKTLKFSLFLVISEEDQEEEEEERLGEKIEQQK